MVRRGALERCETGANLLETRGKRKPVTPENDPRETGLSFLNGGGGGSRTHVRSSCRKGVYKHSRFTYVDLVSKVSQPTGNPSKPARRFNLNTRATCIGEPAKSTPGPGDIFPARAGVNRPWWSMMRPGNIFPARAGATPT